MRIKLEDLETAEKEKSLVFLTDWRGNIIDPTKPLSSEEKLLVNMAAANNVPVEYVARMGIRPVICYAYQWGIDNFKPCVEAIEHGADEMVVTDKLFAAIKAVIKKHILPFIDAILGDAAFGARGYFGYCSAGDGEGDHEFMLAIPRHANDLAAVKTFMSVNAERIDRYVAREFRERCTTKRKPLQKEAAM